MNEQESIQCSCFNNPLTTSTSGLKPSKLVLSQPSALLKNSQNLQSKAIMCQLDTSKAKTSLKRSKPQTRPTVVNPTFTVPPFYQNTNLNQVFALRQIIPKVKPIVKQHQQHVMNFGQQRVNYLKKKQLFFSERNDEMGKRLENKNLEPILSNCNIASMSTTQRTPKIIIKYQNKHSIRSNEGSQFKIPSQQIIFKLEQLQMENPTGKSRKSSSSTQKRCKNNRSSTNHHQPHRMILKQIESLVDENDLNDDLSEVIGRGWDEDEDSFKVQKDKEFTNQTQTYPTSASNIKN